MTTVTRAAVVGITVHAIVLVVHLSLVVVFMAIDTRKDTVIRAIVVAIGAGVPFSIMPTTIDREVLLIMVERRGVPTRFIVALRTIRWELG
jgi:hypothetical protein